MSQPAVAGAVSACEADLGILLFERTSRGMDPTAAGHTFCKRIGAAIGHLKSAENLIHQRRDQKAGKVPLHRLVSETHLRALTAVIETGSFSQAARRLGLSQPSVHRAAREIETICGVTLWRRDGATIEPSSEARMLARHSDLAFTEIRMGLDELEELQGIIEGTVTIGALPLSRSKWLPKAVTLTLAQFPMARVRIIDGPYDEQLTALLHGRIDLILGALRNPPPSRDVVQDFAFEDSLLIVVRNDHPIARGFDSEHDTLAPEQLAQLSWILPRPGTPTRTNFDNFMAASGFNKVRRVIECSSLVATRALLMQGDHAALLSRQQIEAEVALHQLKIMGPPLTGSARPIGITQRRDFKPTRLHEIFLNNLRQVVTDEL